MLLYLLRHADAETPSPPNDDRVLSEKGHSQAAKVARFCETHGITLSQLLTSPLKRAQETAAPVGVALKIQPVIAPWLTSGMHPEEALEQLRALREQKSVMIVGHEPDFSQLIALLLGLPTNQALNVRKASLTLLELSVYRPGAGALQFTLPGKLM
jgi:phosphohistidine phosphatase